MTTLNLQVAASVDDAHELSDLSTLNYVASHVWMKAAPASSARRNGAVRWAVSVPNAATISVATLQLYCNNASYDDPNFDLYCEAADNASDFTTSFVGRTKTTATLSVATTGVGVGWQSYTVTSLVQEIINRAGWVSGNYLAILIMAKTTSGQFRTTAWDTDTSLAAKLDITYTAGGLAYAERGILRGVGRGILRGV